MRPFFPRILPFSLATTVLAAWAMLSLGAVGGCWGKSETKAVPPPPDPRPKAIIKTRFGEMEMKFYPELAPKHVENFIALAKSGFYNGTIFHRVIPGFMIQGGDPNTKNLNKPETYGQGGPSQKLNAEFNDIPLRRGIFSMARTNDPNSAGSQFFI